MASRPEGYYWIIDGKGAPEVAAWFEGWWWLTGCEEAALEKQVVVLSGRLEAPPATSVATR